MSPQSLALRRSPPAELLPRRRSRFERLQVSLADGASTTVHLASYDARTFVPRVVMFEQPEPLVRWCRRNGVRHAVVGGFFARPQYAPLGELRIAGDAKSSVAFDHPWGSSRACVEIAGGGSGLPAGTSCPPSPTVICSRPDHCSCLAAGP
jgi:hypothetical protein